MIKNIVFDIGNVLVKWAPHEVVERFFPEAEHHDQLTKDLFKSQSWLDLNMGKLSEGELIKIYNKTHNIDISKLEELMKDIKASLTPLEGSFKLLDRLYKAGIPLYSITDNVHEIVAYLKSTYDFWPKFKGVAMSADIGILKPNAEIYEYLLKNYNLKPEECIFFDDVLKNVEGAKAVGMQAIQFTTAAACERELERMGIDF
jgi:putative hydrolase of the HAD superfamily